MRNIKNLLNSIIHTTNLIKELVDIEIPDGYEEELSKELDKIDDNLDEIHSYIFDHVEQSNSQ